jgi:hypothetical protein
MVASKIYSSFEIKSVTVMAQLICSIGTFERNTVFISCLHIECVLPNIPTYSMHRSQEKLQ